MHVWSPQMVEARLTSESKSALESLKELNNLKKEGALTEEEYERAKSKLLKKL